MLRWPLRNQLLFPQVGVILLAIVGSSVATAVVAARWIERHTAQQLANIAQTVREADFPLTERVLEQMRGLSGAAFVVTDGQGEAQLATDDLLAAWNQPPHSEALSSRLGSLLEVGGKRFFHNAVPIHSASHDSDAVLHVLYPEDLWRTTRWQVVFPPLVAGGIALSLVVLVTLVVTRSITSRVARLQTQVQQLTQGDHSAWPLPRQQDELRSLVGSVNQLALQLESSQQAIVRSERLAVIGQLSGGLAHHLRNCVAGARLALQLHQRHCQQNDPESLEVALRQLTLSENHLRQLLTLGKPGPLQLTSCDLARLLDELRELIELTSRHRKVTVTFPRLEQPIWLHADAEQLRQLLLNLCLNALDAVGVNGRVWLDVQLAPRQVVLQIRDSGPGPSAEVRSRLFEPFVTTKPEGIGLGLCVARQIAELHGGELRFCEGPETCFELTFPRMNEHAPIGEPQLTGATPS